MKRNAILILSKLTHIIKYVNAIIEINKHKKKRGKKRMETNTEEQGLKCPKCGSTNLQAISDTKGKGASFWKLCFCGLLGLCGTGKTTTEHFWVCSNCGNKFKM